MFACSKVQIFNGTLVILHPQIFPLMLNVSTKDILHHIDNELFRCLGRTADALSCPCYIVGEFVRDIFLGHEGKHVEVIVEGDSVSLAEAFVSDW